MPTLFLVSPEIDLPPRKTKKVLVLLALPETQQMIAEMRKGIESGTFLMIALAPEISEKQEIKNPCRMLAR